MKRLLIALILIGGIAAVAFASLTSRNYKKEDQKTEKKAEKKSKKECKRTCIFS
jgi:hypothetical protein